jgi:hypothetical protein
MRMRYRRFVYERAVVRFLREELDGDPSHRTLECLVHGWDNAHYSAAADFLAASVRHARTDGAILECGSGLTTVLLGIVAQRRGLRVWSLEHRADWADRVRAELARLGISSVELVLADLRSYGDFTWYQPPLAVMPSDFALVVCDGPPGGTSGGRYGLLPVMRSRLRPGCVILLDDANRPGERAIAERWASELGVDVACSRGEKNFATLVVSPDPVKTPVGPPDARVI